MLIDALKTVTESEQNTTRKFPSFLDLYCFYARNKHASMKSLVDNNFIYNIKSSTINVKFFKCFKFWPKIWFFNLCNFRKNYYVIFITVIYAWKLNFILKNNFFKSFINFINLLGKLRLYNDILKVYISRYIDFSFYYLLNEKWII